MNLFLLSHHRDHELHRTWRLGGLHLCARCLGLYPVLALGLVLQLRFGAPLHWEHDFLFVLGLTAPGLWDWSRGVRDPASGSNGLRTLTGVLLGAAFARSLYVHLQQPLHWLLPMQLAAVLLVVIPALAWLRTGER